MFYGTTVEGGQYGMGTVFLLSPPRGLFGWSITILYSFRGTDGGYPYDGLTLDAGNNLYGATRYGGSHSCGAFSCGAVFKLSPPVLARTQWTETVLH
ncbi:MAG TPA: choice-of-anchor tandem repeat GloVer-containing protein, partial [Bryobacteraceae bacterium]|nr:choice-of-anchor tandem repeat GloVer-containing protein [Bryobacteraceae bacterium]